MTEYVKKQRKRYCYFCKEHINHIDYKDVQLLKRFVSDKNKIKARRVTGTCALHQRPLAAAIKRAREIALLAYSKK